MSSRNLEDYLNENPKIKLKEEVIINWEDEKNKWLKAIDDFYQNVQEWLKPFIDRKQVEIEYKEIFLQEENIGKYMTKAMYILISNEKVLLEPIGTLLIGAHGKIDMKGKNGIIKFLLVDEKSKGFRISVTILSELSNKQKIEKAEKDAKDAKNVKDAKLVWKMATPAPNTQFLSLDGDTFSDALLSIIE